MRTRLRAGSSLVLAFLLCAGAMPAMEKTPQVELALHCIAVANGPELRVSLRNTGTGDANVVFGITLGNGRTYHAATLFLEAKRRGGDAVESFQIADSTYRIAGRLDPWIVPCPWGPSLPSRGRLAFSGPLMTTVEYQRLHGAARQADLTAGGSSARR